MAFIRNLTITFYYCGSAKHCLWNVFVAEFSSSFSSIRNLCRICNSSVNPKMNAVAHTQLTFQMLPLLQKISISPEPVFKNMGQQMSGPDKSNCQSIQHESEGRGFESPSGRDIFCLNNFDTFTRTPLRVSKMNAVARTVNISNVNFTSKISIPPEPVFKNMGQQMSGLDISNG